MKILINSVFVGGYGFNKGNLPHEMINFFKADDGNYYVYITPYGVIDNKIDIDDLRAVLFVRSVGNSLVEILAKAEIDKESIYYTKGIQLYGNSNKDSSKIKQIKEDTIAQRERKAKYFNDTKHIMYSGKTLREIHSGNLQDNDVFVTLKVKSICLPKKTMYLTHRKNAVELRPCVFYVGQELSDNSKIANQSMKMYFDEIRQHNGYCKLSKLIDNSDLWLSPENTPMFSDASINNKCNFFKITRQQDNEIMFSNMFYYLFSEYPILLRKFSSTLLNINLDSNVIIEREKDHMDLRIIDDKNYIIIENKIKSTINGMKSESKVNNSKIIYKAENGKYVSQLSDYYYCALNRNKKDGIQRIIHGFIFTPNYNPIDKSQYLYGDKYNIITYKKLYEFFSEYIKHTTNEGANDLYLQDFILAMKKHTEDTDNEFRDELMQRLSYRINNN